MTGPVGGLIGTYAIAASSSPAKAAFDIWGRPEHLVKIAGSPLHETQILRLDIAKRFLASPERRGWGCRKPLFGPGGGTRLIMTIRSTLGSPRNRSVHLLR